MDVDVPLGSMDVDVTNIHGYPSNAFTATAPSRFVCLTSRHKRIYSNENNALLSYKNTSIRKTNTFDNV
jgi:hypothetical protein